VKYDIVISKEQLLNPLLDDSGYDIAAGFSVQPQQEQRAMKFATMIPQNYNDGNPVSHIRAEAIYRLFWNKFGGCTVDAVADGYWYGESDRMEMKLYKDKVRRLTVVTEKNSQANLDYARLLVRRAGQILRQKCMYFEHDFDLAVAVEFLDINQTKDYVGLSDKYEDIFATIDV